MRYTGKTPCKYGPVFAPDLHDWTLYSINTVQKTGPYLHGVFPVIVSLLLSKSFIFSKVTDDTCNAHCLERSVYYS